jgi:hypothetical protein
MEGLAGWEMEMRALPQGSAKEKILLPADDACGMFALHRVLTLWYGLACLHGRCSREWRIDRVRFNLSNVCNGGSS